MRNFGQGKGVVKRRKFLALGSGLASAMAATPLLGFAQETGRASAPSARIGCYCLVPRVDCGSVERAATWPS